MNKLLLILVIGSAFSLNNYSFVANVDLGYSAASAILMEMNSKRVIYEKNCDKISLPASITKIMTAIVAIENGELEKYYVVTSEVAFQEGSRIYLDINDQLTLEQLLYGMMLRSGNDAAYMIACNVFNDYDKFIFEMNELAKKIKMTSSVFNNPSGLDTNTQNYSTARDMATLMTYAMENSIFRKIVSTTKYECQSLNQKKYVFYNKHKLVNSNDFVTGGKTGYTVKAKRTLVTTFKKNNMEVVVVTFNCGNDWEVHQNLANYAFDNYEMVKLLEKGIIDINNHLYNATPIIYEDIVFPLKEDEKVKCTIYILNNPKEEVIGKVVIVLNNHVQKEVLIYRYY